MLDTFSTDILFLDDWSEITGTLTATETIDESPYLLMNCTRIFRIPVNMDFMLKLRPEIGSKISIMKTDAGFRFFKHQTEESEVEQSVSSDKLCLNYHGIPVGEYFLAPSFEGRELNCIPLSSLSDNNEAYQWLKRKLHETTYSFKVFENGKVSVTIPNGHKYGFILGWVSWAFHQSTLMEQ